MLATATATGVTRRYVGANRKSTFSELLALEDVETFGLQLTEVPLQR